MKFSKRAERDFLNSQFAVKSPKIAAQIFDKQYEKSPNIEIGACQIFYVPCRETGSNTFPGLWKVCYM
jgi:hypothetical protein